MDDLRFALRQLRKGPGFTFVAVLTLGLGIAANSSVFGLLSGLLYRPVPADRPEELVWVAGQGRRGWRNLSYPEYVAYRGLDSVFTGVLTWHQVPLALASGGEPQQVAGLLVSGNYFDVAGVRPALGRTFTAEEDGARGAHPVVILSHALWRSRFGSDSGIVGRPITVNGRPFTVVGVAPRGFTSMEFDEPPALFIPMAMQPALMPTGLRLLDSPDSYWLWGVGRLAPGMTPARADAAVRLIAAQRAQADSADLAGTTATVVPMRGGLPPANRAEVAPVFALLMVVPLLVLLIACANVANLLLSRAAARRREVGVRLALGASRGRLVRQLLVESVVLALAGGATGFLISLWLGAGILALTDAPPFLAEIAAPDHRVAVFTAGLSLLTGVLFGLAPAIGATRSDVVTVLKDEAGTAPRGRSRLAGAFVVAQVAASLVLLVVSGLFLRSLGKATMVDIGFETRGRVTATFDLGLLGYDPPRRDVFFRELLERVRAIPGVGAATLTSNLPLSGRLYTTDAIAVEPGAGAGAGEATVVQASWSWIWPDYFRTMGTPLLAGRDFAIADDTLATGVVIVNETLARRLWPGEDPLGRHLRRGGGNPPLEVVGVVRDGKYDELTEDGRAFMYVPQRQEPAAESRMTLLALADGGGEAVIGALRSLFQELDRNLPVFDVRPLDSQVALRLDKERAISTLLGVFGTVALLLATLGLYAVMAHAVARRTREMGIRIALGAARRHVLALVVGDGVRLAAIGIAIGLLLAAALTRIVRRFLYGVTPTDLVTFVAVAALLAAVAALASWVPARRATRVDPVVALRAE